MLDLFVFGEIGMGVAVDGERLPTAAVGSCVAGMSQSGKSGRTIC